VTRPMWPQLLTRGGFTFQLVNPSGSWVCSRHGWFAIYCTSQAQADRRNDG
jgi:hypothetical protein